MPKRTTPTRRQAAIAALVSGASYGNAAAAAGVGVRTLYEWRQQPEFQRELSIQQYLIRERLTDRIVDTALESVRVLAGVQKTAEYDSVRVQAASAVLRHAAQIMATDDYNKALNVLRRYGLVAIPEDKLIDQGLESLKDYDVATELPWEAEETEGGEE